MSETRGQSRRQFLRELAGRAARIGSGALLAGIVDPDPALPEAGASDASAALAAQLAGMNDLSGILEPRETDAASPSSPRTGGQHEEP